MRSIILFNLLILGLFGVISSNVLDLPTKSDCAPCFARCTKHDGILDCPLEKLDQNCITCYKTAVKKEKEHIQDLLELEMDGEKILKEIDQLPADGSSSVAALKRAIKMSETKQAELNQSVKEAFKRALEKTTNVDEAIQMVKEEVGESTYRRVALGKRIVCAGLCVAAGTAVASGIATGIVHRTGSWW